ncbi:MAG: hypothetical protein HC796_00170 [Synechococcaceae cyanobacterium RL_1_2]|nr:hypothetical protein [Synechococcaceae cyanobacterium RL_1_2]
MGTLDQSTDSYDLDRWELLNAYLDGELTTVEEQQIEQWLQEDPTYRHLYQHLIALSEGCHRLPEPPPSASYGELYQGVFAEIDKQESIDGDGGGRRPLLWG